MKKYHSLLLIIFIFILLYSCGQVDFKPIVPTPPATKQLINPGDKIGDFRITTAGEDDIFYITKIHCPFDNRTKTEFCEQPVGTKVNVGMGIYEDNAPGGKTIDEYWSDQTHKIYIEGYPINLESFGTVEFTTRREGPVRVWNVVIVSDKPGTVTAQSIGVVGGNPFEYTAVVTFKEP